MKIKIWVFSENERKLCHRIAQSIDCSYQFNSIHFFLTLVWFLLFLIETMMMVMPLPGLSDTRKRQLLRLENCFTSLTWHFFLSNLAPLPVKSLRQLICFNLKLLQRKRKNRNSFSNWFCWFVSLKSKEKSSAVCLFDPKDWPIVCLFVLSFQVIIKRVSGWVSIFSPILYLLCPLFGDKMFVLPFACQVFTVHYPLTPPPQPSPPPPVSNGILGYQCAIIGSV